MKGFIAAFIGGMIGAALFHSVVSSITLAIAIGFLFEDLEGNKNSI